MLFGAAKLCKLFEVNDLGNPVNYFKDAVYLHSRNLYNFFSSNTNNDAKVSAFTSHQFNLSLYNTWKGALHDHALHIKCSRGTPTNVINGVHINEQIQHFATDIDGLWKEWIRNTNDLSLKKELQDALTKAKRESTDDYDKLQKQLALPS